MERLQAALADLDVAGPAQRLRTLIQEGHADLPPPGGGHTLMRWRALSTVAALDLSLVKLFEGHTDALAVLAEAGHAPVQPEAAYGMWAAEPPHARVRCQRSPTGGVSLTGTKAWCSGAAGLDRALLTVWDEQGGGPWLADVDLCQDGITINEAAWKAVGMSDTVSAEVRFESVPARLIGDGGFYLSRPGFWQGGIGIAACWHGAAGAVADALLAQTVEAREPGWHRLLALGQIDRLLSANAALLREAADWIDHHPHADAQDWALRTRAASDEAAQQVLRAATRAMGAGPLCLDPRFARLAADLPVFIRQSHGDRDLVALGERARHAASTDTARRVPSPWTL
ncbi:acyl-CoA dehydrogenase family protein [Roseateles amylovorans]|uniref:Acyl-CoA/acyl-ACP dehydrogenase n=1 Tax=Roseateles amylovorans TaxID=2978473 RepID=A0ABY6B6E5_9BURK|nr:acyl-CoA dehydrogenase family protein [Roseateles amylovorans]UXH79129.1 acyl-CoA/acyl-ACP dehydrogenase [Roseateles amylovorans]